MLTLRPAVPEDAPLILQYIRELAEYERELKKGTPPARATGTGE